jgi:hypothetical protein
VLEHVEEIGEGGGRPVSSKRFLWGDLDMIFICDIIELEVDK